MHKHSQKCTYLLLTYYGSPVYSEWSVMPSLSLICLSN